MADKPSLLILYVLFGLLLGLWPTFACYPRKPAGVSTTPLAGGDLRTISICLLIIVFGWFWLGAAAAPELAGAFVLIAFTAAFHQGRIVYSYALVIFTGLMVAATLPWWRHDPGHALSLSWVELSAFTVITTVTLWILKTDGNNLEPSIRFRGIWVLLIGLFVLVEAALSFTTGFFYNTGMLVIAWLHWGAYIQSSELLLAGAKLFHDFPATYGFGPTVLIASICGKSCWNGMYYLVGFCTLLFSLLIAAIALGSSKQGLPQKGLVLLLCLFSCFFWTGVTPLNSLPLKTPALSGLRYLPVLALVALLLWLDRRGSTRSSAIWGHLAWAAAALWSIESAFYATFVWWPYYLLLCSAKAPDRRTWALGLLRALSNLLGVFVALILCFLAGYWLVYRTSPSVYGYFAYALYPPGPLPVDGKGPVWFFIAVMALGIAANWQVFRQSGNSMAFRRGFLLLLLIYGIFCYYLGSSHDNFISGHLVPFMLLVLLNIRTSPIPQAWRMAAVVLLASLLGWLSMFEWHAWRYTAETGRLLEFNPTGFRQALSYENPDTQQTLLSEPADLGNPEDTARAISYIRQRYGEYVTVVNAARFLTSTDSRSVWSAIHCLDNYVSLPAVRRREFLLRTASTLKRSGWLVIQKSYPNSYVVAADFDSVYRRTQELDFGSYYAIRYTPLI